MKEQLPTLGSRFLAVFKACESARYNLLTNTNFTMSLKIKETLVKGSYVRP